MIDPDTGAIEDANASAARFYGYSKDDLHQMHIEDLNVLPPAQIATYRKEAEGRARNHFTFLHRLSDGAVRTVEVHSTPIQTQDKTLLFSIIHDITQRRNVENQLRRRANLEALIVQLSTQFINTPAEDVDASIEDALESIGSFIGADRSYVFQFRGEGPPREQVTDNTHEWSAEGIAAHKARLQGIPCASLPWWIDQLTRLEPLTISSVAELPPEAAATRAVLERQNIRSLVVVPMVWEGTLIGFVGFDVVRPETELPDNAATLLKVVGDILINALKQRETDVALRESEARFRILAEHATDVIARHDSQGRFAYVSPSVRDILGYEPDTLIGTDPYALIHPDDRARVRRAHERVKRGTPCKVEYRARTKDGRYRWVEGSGQGVLDPQTGRLKSIVTAARDITERKATEQALRQARADAEAANRAKTAFLANISHEVRTPLNGIVGMASLLERTALSPRQQQCVDTLRTSGNTLLNLINDLLDLSKIEAGKLDLEAQPFDPREAVHEVVRLVAPQAAEKALELVCRIDETVPIAPGGRCGASAADCAEPALERHQVHRDGERRGARRC